MNLPTAVPRSTPTTAVRKTESFILAMDDELTVLCEDADEKAEKL